MSMQLAQSLNLGKEAVTQKIPGAAAAVADPNQGMAAWITNMLSAIMLIASLMVLIFFIWAAIEWITSGGDSGKVQKAREKITQAIIGLIVLASSYAIFSVLQTVLGL